MTCGMNLELDLEALRRTYRTRSAEEGVAVEDEVHLGVALLPVLDDASMRSIVREMLRERGWRDVDDGSLQKGFGDAVAVLSPDGASIALRAKGSGKVTASASAAVRDGEGGEAKADREADRVAGEKLRELVAKERERLASANLDELVRQEPALREEVQQSLNRTYRRALEERARQMGEVESIDERGGEGGTYEVTVVVKA